MKRIVVFGGGTGLSSLLSGLKLFPVDVTTVIAVSDNGSSTGQLREELDIPAVGDVGKVLLAMSNVEDDFTQLLGYRFKKQGSLHNHPVRNILLAALIDQKGSLSAATQYMSKLLRVKGTVLPLTEEQVDLVGTDESGHPAYYGEEDVSRNVSHIRRLKYDHEFRVNPEVLNKIAEADLIIFSYGSLYTSLLPHLIAPEIIHALHDAKAPLMYVCNLVTQPGETDGYTVSQHVNVLNSYLKGRTVDIVLANDSAVDNETRERYLTRENKTIVELDRDNLTRIGTEVISGDIFRIAPDSGSIRHDALRTAYLVFSYLMENTEIIQTQDESE